MPDQVPYLDNSDLIDAPLSSAHLGCTNAVFTVVFAVITDVTAHRIAHRRETSSGRPNTSEPSLLSSDDNIAHHFGLVGAGWGAGVVLGPVTGGFLLHKWGIRVPFFASAAICGACSMVVAFGVTESLHKAQAFSWGRANPIPFLRWVRQRGHTLPL